MSNGNRDRRFDRLYRELAGSWYQHQLLRDRGDADFAELAVSAGRVDRARAEMRKWRTGFDGQEIR